LNQALAMMPSLTQAACLVVYALAGAGPTVTGPAVPDGAFRWRALACGR
jgi:hypothetical protein